MGNPRQNEPDGKHGPPETEGGMCLEDLAHTIAYLGDAQLVIDDNTLLQWARSRNLSPRDAQIEALRNRVIPLRYAKNFHALTLTEQKRICESRVLICGCGGIGGILINLLARAGVGTLRLVDGDVFSSSNLNRQWFCETPDLSRLKAQVAGERLRAINPLIEVEVLPTFMDEHNADTMAQGMNLVMDALDNLPGRFHLANAAKRMKTPFIHAAVSGWWGQVSTFLPESPLNLHNVFGNRREREPAEVAMGVLGPAPGVIGSLAAFEAIRILSGRKAMYADQLLFLDGESGRIDVIALE